MKPKLFMVLIGATPPGRNTEQHDIFFGIAESLGALVPEMKAFWPEAKGAIHIDAWREVTQVDGFSVRIVPKSPYEKGAQLYFLNLGGYVPGEFEERHYKMLVVADSMGLAVKSAKQTAFYKHCSFPGAESHIDEKFGVDVDDAYKVADILPETFRTAYSILVEPNPDGTDDALHIGYVKIARLKP